MSVSTSRALGIDLGTTHCVLSEVELSGDAAKSRVIAVPQLISSSELQARPQLPSFLYFPSSQEGAMALPWDGGRDHAVGSYARERAAEAPSRVVASAKSWLCHPSADRRAGILPLGAADGIETISPVECAWRYLEHLNEAYEQLRGLTFADCEVVLTVPASFDAAARELTVEAAMAAGVEQLTLLEEPQAALYAWLEAQGDAWRNELKPGDVVLVVDVGGGTSDFSAIAVDEEQGELRLERVAVGDHILLGGDNMDLALAHLVRQRLEAEGKEIDGWQQTALTHACRNAKERLLSDPALDSVAVRVASRGAQLVGGVLRYELRRQEVHQLVVEGFMPSVEHGARPLARRRTGLTRFGLPYASDPAITKHLAAFLGRHSDAQAAQGRQLLHPTAVLFNGGVMRSGVLRDRLVDTLNAWLCADGGEAARVLGGGDVDLAVSRGAASYARVRHGHGIRIRGGTARAYYVGIEAAVPAIPGLEPPLSLLCVAPFGMQEGSVVDLEEHELAVVVGEPVRFRFFGSSVRRQDAAGCVHERYRQLEIQELSPIEVTLPAQGRPEGDVVPVRLRASVTEVGTLSLEAVPLEPKQEDESWKIELSVRENA